MVMPKGFANSLAAFQCVMNDIFVDIIDVMVIIYLDNILLYSDNIAEHKAHVCEVFWQLSVNGTFAHADKCEFHVTSHEYLGYMLSSKGLTMAPSKYRSSKIGLNPKRSRIFNTSLALPTFTIVSSISLS